MNTQHLKYAIEVERTGSITQAADNLYIGQPSLSKAIKELEDTLGITIFKRTSKGALPTEKGAEFLKYARAVMVQIEKMEMLYRPANPDRQTLSVSVPKGGYVARAAIEFAAGLGADKELEIRIAGAECMDAIADVGQGRTGIGIIRFRKRDEGYFSDYLTAHQLRREPVWEYDPAVVFARKHPLADRLPLRAEMLFSYAEVALEEEMVPYVQQRREERPDRRSDKLITVCNQADALELTARIPGAYTWCEPQPEELLAQHRLVQRGCSYLEGRMCDALIYLAGHEFTSMEKRFINKLYECRNQLAFRDEM